MLLLSHLRTDCKHYYDLYEIRQRRVEDDLLPGALIVIGSRWRSEHLGLATKIKISAVIYAISYALPQTQDRSVGTDVRAYACGIQINHSISHLIVARADIAMVFAVADPPRVIRHEQGRMQGPT